MKFRICSETCKGTERNFHRDNIILKYSASEKRNALMLVLCEELCKNESFSICAEIIETFSSWYNTEMERIIENENLFDVTSAWKRMIRKLNSRYFSRAMENEGTAGATFTGIFILDDNYCIVHIGDAVIYQITKQVRQLTADETNKEKNACFFNQCIGGSDEINPKIIYGRTCAGIYCAGTSGFRNTVTESDLLEFFPLSEIDTEAEMQEKGKRLMDILHRRRSNVDMSAVLMKLCR